MFFSSQPTNKMSVEKNSSKSPKKFDAPKYKVPLSVENISSGSLQGTNLLQQMYAVKLMNPVSIEDTTLALTLTIQGVLGEKKRFLDVQLLSTSLINYGGTDFPEGIELCCDELNGYMSEAGVATHCVAITQPLTVTSVANPGGIIGYNVLYDAKNAPIWDITNVNTLNFRLKLFGQSTYRDLPSAQPITCVLKVSRVIF